MCQAEAETGNIRLNVQRDATCLDKRKQGRRGGHVAEDAQRLEDQMAGVTCARLRPMDVRVT